MKNMSINPVKIVQEHVKELYHQYRTTDDPERKEVLARRLRNLKNVLQFLSRTQNGTTTVENYT